MKHARSGATVSARTLLLLHLRLLLLLRQRLDHKRQPVLQGRQDTICKQE
jgi:hypothetical protein